MVAAHLQEMEPGRNRHSENISHRDKDPDLITETSSYIAEDQHNYEVERLRSLEQDREQRKKYAGRIFWLVCAWLLALVAILSCVGTSLYALSDAVLVGLITGASVNIIALMVIVANYLFPKK